MTRLLLVCHAGVGEALCEVAGIILGRPAELGLISVSSDDDADVVMEAIGHEVRQLCREDPPLLLTDLPGATPHNLALNAVGQLCPDAPVLSGVNLAMLLRALTHLDQPAGALAQMVAEGGRNAIVLHTGQ